MARLALIVVPAGATAHRLRVAFTEASGSLGGLADSVLGLSIVLVAAECLGLVGLDHSSELIAALVAAALVTRLVVPPPRVRRAPAQEPSFWRTPWAVTSVVIVVAQWCVQTANALGGGMLNFDTLWYHMPFAARFAQSGAVTGIQFTQADPFVAYYPANSELFHAIGIVAMHNDFLSPFLNLMWLALGLLAAWCIGLSRGIAPLTLTAGALVMSLPVLAGTQPGEAFNDVAGLAAVLAATAFLLGLRDRTDRSIPPLAGLALGLAIGTKLTFIVPALVLLAGGTLAARRRARLSALVALGGGTALTGGWWYLRNLIADGNPVGLRAHIGPLSLPGPVSPLAHESQQTVFSELRHVSLWGSRFIPGLNHALGPLWPVLIVLSLAGIIAGLWFGDRVIRAAAVAAALAGIAYVFAPTGATDIAQGTQIFQVNVRYATPALALGLVLLPFVIRSHARWLMRYAGPLLALVLFVTQFERALWPTQPARHALFIAGVAAVALALSLSLSLSRRDVVRRLPGPAVGASLAALAVAGGGAAYAVQRHYFSTRYLKPVPNHPGLSAIYAWAHGLSGARIALYGSLEQYPLYGASDTNHVDYLGAKRANGGYAPIASCSAWRAALNRGHYEFVVQTPGPTAPVPLAWTEGDTAATVVINPARSYYVFRVGRRFTPAGC